MKKEKINNQINRRLDKTEIKKIMEKYPQLKQTVEHFVIEFKDEKGKEVAIYLPKWRTIDKKEGDKIARLLIEDAIESVLKEHNIA